MQQPAAKGITTHLPTTHLSSLLVLSSNLHVKKEGKNSSWDSEGKVIEEENAFSQGSLQALHSHQFY